MRCVPHLVLSALLLAFGNLVFADTVAVTPDSLGFGNQVVGTWAFQYNSVLSNGTKKALHISGISATGDFSYAGGSCGAVLDGGANCVIYVSFVPSATGPRSGVLTISDDSTDGTQKVKLSGTGIPIQLVSLAVTPAATSAIATTNVHYFATGTFNNGAILDLTSGLTWTSSAPSIASIGADGVAAALTPGGTTISASSGAVAGSTTLMVTPLVLQSIAVTPSSANVQQFHTQQFAATATYNNGSTRDLTNTVQWSSAPTQGATVSNSGLATGNAPGTTIITAALSGLSGSASLFVKPAVAVSLTISPSSFFTEYSVQLLAIATYDNGSTGDVTATASWSSSWEIATVNSSGLVSCVQIGTATVGATVAQISSFVAKVECAVTEPRSFMTSPRYLHTATPLADGRVLIAGGVSNAGPLASVESYDSTTRYFTPFGSLNVPRSGHTATLLNNGKVLIAGGDSAATAEILDPSISFSTLTGSMTSTHDAAILLNNGRVLMVGNALAAEMYDPATGMFTTIGNTSTLRSGETATLLGNGQVLIAGGRSETAEVFDPASGQFTLVGNMSAPRTHHTATLLASGKVWIAGGDDGITTLPTTEIYDPSTGTFTPSAGMSDARAGHTATRFVNGQVLVAGGTNNSAYLATGEIYDPAVGAFVITGSTVLSHNDSGTRALHTATRLADGTVIICGGMTSLGITARGLLFVPQP